MRKGLFSTYTGWIILANIIAFVAFLVLISAYGEESAINLFALQPKAVLTGFAFWTLITSMFLHANFTHLFVNMISLMFIGSFVERLVGNKRFLIFYFVAGLASGLLFVLLAGFFGDNPLGMRLFGSPLTYAVGASGAIFGLGGLLAVLTPKLRVLLFFIIPMPMWFAMIGMLAILWLLSFSAGLPIGNVAHLGGLLIGVAYGFYLKHKYPRKTAMISRYFSR
jgi:uncharacterized protein